MKPALSMVLNSLFIPYERLSKNDVLLAHGQPSNWIAYRTCELTGVPYFAYLHQVNRFQKPRMVDIKEKWGPDANIRLLKAINEKNPVIKHLDIVSVRNASGVFTNSRWIRNQIADYYRVDSKVVYPGIDVRNKVGKDEWEEIILTTNRHYPQKRIDYLLKVMSMVVKERPSARCVITGGFTKHTNQLITLKEKLGLKKHVEFTGIIPEKELGEAYTQASLYSFTSPEEDLGLGPLEAGSYGTPSIVWDYAGPRETVVDGITGVRVEPHDTCLMAKEMCSLLDDRRKRRKMGENARRHVNRHFSWDRHCQNLIEAMKVPGNN